MNKITSEHPARDAYVYIRQSTADQLANNPESRHRQYALKVRAEALGWQNVVVIDDDLGRSGGGVARKGFERLLVAIGNGIAGAVLAIEASRLARNGRDWHTLLEFCGLVGCLLIDEDGVYDPRLVNDRLLLGMKGTFSELELSILRQRSQEALRLKASRGDLRTSVALGYVRSPKDRLEMDPDRRVREVVGLIFRKFDEVGSVRQVAVWLRQEGIELPRFVYGEDGRGMAWRLPRYNSVHRILTNPVYAGAYVFGPTASQVRVEAGRKVVKTGIPRRREEWSVLIRDHHAGYITWDQYERNQRLISDNANMKGAMVPRSVRNGGGLLAGLLRCGHCGRKLTVRHNGLRGVARYLCNGASVNHASRDKCIAFGNMRIDAAVSAEVLRAVSPFAIEAALAAVEAGERVSTERIDQLASALEQARYEAARAGRQYNRVEPENRIVAAELERRWNKRLGEVERLEAQIRAAQEMQSSLGISASERAELMALADDLPRAWNHPAATAETRKRTLRTVLEEIVVRVDADHLQLKLHWTGGDHTALELPKTRHGGHRWKTSTATEQLIQDLARLLPDGSIAAAIDRSKPSVCRSGWWNTRRSARLVSMAIAEWIG
jgi:DNA invertase Pin-like site-specific DNA recombinase